MASDCKKRLDSAYKMKPKMTNSIVKVYLSLLKWCSLVTREILANLSNMSQFSCGMVFWILTNKVRWFVEFLGSIYKSSDIFP